MSKTKTKTQTKAKVPAKWKKMKLGDLLCAYGNAATAPMEEGCLSTPGVRGTIFRPEAVTVQYTDVQGRQQTLEARGLLARVVQHEFDHLQGVSILNKMTRKSLVAAQPQLNVLRSMQLVAQKYGAAT